MADRSKRGFKHRLVLEPRGDLHHHPFLPTCPCGWSGIPSFEKFGAKQYRSHLHQVENVVLHGIGDEIRRQRPTPHHLLPEALR